MPITIKGPDGQKKEIVTKTILQKMKELIADFGGDSIAEAQLLAYHFGLGTPKQREAIEEGWHPSWYDVHFGETGSAEKLIPADWYATIVRQGNRCVCTFVLGDEKRTVMGAGKAKNIDLAVCAALIDAKDKGHWPGITKKA